VDVEPDIQDHELHESARIHQHSQCRSRAPRHAGEPRGECGSAELPSHGNEQNQSERSELLDSAEYLNLKMREIRDGGNIIGLDRIAVMAALNLANELLKVRRHGEPSTEVSPRLRQMRERAEAALAKGQQLDL